MTEEPEVVVVTGAGAGLGRAIVREFARRGAWIGLIARDEARLQAARGEVEAHGGKAMVLPCDVADADAVFSAAQQVVDAWGRIDTWVNDAMTTVFSPVAEMTPDDYRRVTEVTYLGVVHGTLAALRHMRARDRGTIVQVGSALAYRSIPLQSAYCGAKHAMVGFTDSLRCELVHDHSHVRVTVVHMPALNTPQFGWCKTRMHRKSQPVPPIFQPEVGARAVYWAAHHKRRELLVGYPTIQAVWAQKFVPGFLDRYLAGRGWEGQLLDEREHEDAPNNLYAPVTGDQQARGAFGQRSRTTAPALWLETRPRWMPAIAGGITAAAAAAGLLANKALVRR